MFPLKKVKPLWRHFMSSSDLHFACRYFNISRIDRCKSRWIPFGFEGKRCFNFFLEACRMSLRLDKGSQLSCLGSLEVQIHVVDGVGTTPNWAGFAIGIQAHYESHSSSNPWPLIISRIRIIWSPNTKFQFLTSMYFKHIQLRTFLPNFLIYHVVQI